MKNKITKLAFSCFLLTYLSGCASVLMPDSLLRTDGKVTPVELSQFTEAEWFNAETQNISHLNITQDDGHTSRGFYLEQNAAKYTVLYFGGNGFRIQDAGIGLARVFSKIGVNFVWIDYRGLGATGGTPSIDRIKKDSQTIIDHLKTLHKPLIIHGISMGSLLASNIASDPKNADDISALVLESAILDLDSLINNMAPGWNPVEKQTDPQWSTYDSVPLVQKWAGPLLLLSSSDDDYTPVANAEKLYRVSSSKQKSIAVIEGASHVNAMTKEQTIEEYRSFLASLN
jgi:fermentation-respiration switch protein FrsA (DUF1100 family)